MIFLLQNTSGQLTLTIQDNGFGIQPDKMRAFGNGIGNMKKRMNDINIEFSIANQNDTLLTLRSKVSEY